MSTEIFDENAEFDRLAEEEAERVRHETVTSTKPTRWMPNKIVPVQNRNSAAKRQRQVAFLKAYEELGTISHACKVAGINPMTQSRWHSDPWYVARFKEAHAAHCDLVEAEIKNRAIHGVEVPIIGKRWNPAAGVVEDDIIGHKTVKSDLLLMFHAKKINPEYRENYKPPEEKPVQVAESALQRMIGRLEIVFKRETGAANIGEQTQLPIIDVPMLSAPQTPQLTDGELVPEERK